MVGINKKIIKQMQRLTINKCPNILSVLHSIFMSINMYSYSPTYLQIMKLNEVLNKVGDTRKNKIIIKLFKYIKKVF
jgi:hypothetical protein